MWRLRGCTMASRIWVSSRDTFTWEISSGIQRWVPQFSGSRPSEARLKVQKMVWRIRWSTVVTLSKVMSSPRVRLSPSFRMYEAVFGSEPTRTLIFSPV
ncbi:hypothetical protein D3C71_1827880 [compost metagenome]